MPVAQANMTQAQQVAVTQAIARSLDETKSPVATGRIRTSRSGAPWVSFGGPRWYRMLDMPDLDDGAYLIVTNNEGEPLGDMVEGPLVIAAGQSGRPTAFTVNTGWNLESEIEWGDH